MRATAAGIRATMATLLMEMDVPLLAVSSQDGSAPEATQLIRTLALRSAEMASTLGF